MAFCPNCGASVEGRFCAKCGTAVGTAPEGTPSGPPPGGAQQYSAPATSGALSENVAGALCYVLGLITGILFLVLAPYNQSKFVRFHAFQAIFFHVSWIGLWIVETIIAVMMPWQLGTLLGVLTLLVSLGVLALWLFLMYKAYNNEKFKLPIIGDLAEKQS
jgi:uncharacterized membrane protein